MVNINALRKWTETCHITNQVWKHRATEEVLDWIIRRSYLKVQRAIARQNWLWLFVCRSLGLYCNRTWDGWLCWDDTPAGTYTSQNCPNYFVDFDSTGTICYLAIHLFTSLYSFLFMHILCLVYLEKVTKYCDATGNWFRHPETNRTWSNYTLCIAHTKDKLKVFFISAPLILERFTVLGILLNAFLTLCENNSVSLICYSAVVFWNRGEFQNGRCSTRLVVEKTNSVYINIAKENKPADVIISRWTFWTNMQHA